MNSAYDQLLRELGISKSQESYENYKRLKEKRTEYMSRMGSQNSPQENQRLQMMLEEIGKAESYFEALSKEEKKENKWDGFDYSSLKGKKKKKKRMYVPESSEVADDQDSATDEPETIMTFEERYDNIIGFMGTPDGFEAGFEQLKQLGEEGCVMAQKRLGMIFYHGEKSVVSDQKSSFYWYEKAALQSDALSQNQIGTMYMKGNGVEVNREAAIKWFEKAVEGGDEDAARNLGLLYEVYFEQKDYPKAAKWYEIAANEFSNADACNRLGLIYINDNGVGPNSEKAIYWLEKAANKFANADACNNLGVMYTNDNGVGPNREKAIYWFEKAYHLGNVQAAGNLGLVYGELFEQRDYQKAAEWYEIAVNESSNADACNRLGLIYMNNNGVGPNREKAIYWLEKAYHMGSEHAAWNLGLVYGELFETKDYLKAVKWYEIAANEFSNVEACNKLGIIYINDNGVGPNREKAIYWLEKAYRMGYDYAAWNLGLVYENRFVKKDYTKALYWYEKAATEQDDSDAMLKLGIIYEDIQADTTLAAQWYLKAIQHGNENARKRFDKLVEKER